MKFLVAFVALVAVAVATPALKRTTSELTDVEAIEVGPVIAEPVEHEPETAEYKPETTENKPEPAEYDPETAENKPEPAEYEPETAENNPEPAEYEPETSEYEPEQESIAVDPAVIEEPEYEPISVGPAIIDFPIPDGALAPTPPSIPSPVVIGPIAAGAPTPLVQIILNINNAASPIPPKPVVKPEPVVVGDEAEPP